MMSPIYLDFAAATPCDPRVFSAMQPYFSEQFFNPSSPYLAARQAKVALENARASVAASLGARPVEIIFTAGATESINMAIRGMAELYPEAEFVTTAIEHEAVLAPIRKQRHKIVDVETSGVVKVTTLREAISDGTVLVSVGFANNEIGTIQPIKDIGQMIEQIRADRAARNIELPLYFHTDASQAGAYLDLHVSRLGVDYLTLNAAKMYGPKQVGALYVRAGLPAVALVLGGGQESGARSGTQNVAGVVGFAKALELVQETRKTEGQRQASLRDLLQKTICEALPDTQVNGNQKKRLPNNLHLSWPDIDGERLVMVLDERGVMAATGSACAANKETGSHVLPAIGLEPHLVSGSLRLTLGQPTTEADVRRTAEIIIQSITDLRQNRA